MFVCSYYSSTQPGKKFCLSCCVKETKIGKMVNEQFKRCVPPTPGDRHELCVICVGTENGCSALEVVGCAQCDTLFVRKLPGSLRRLQLWGSQMELAEDLEGVSLTSFASSVALKSLPQACVVASSRFW